MRVKVSIIHFFSFNESQHFELIQIPRVMIRMNITNISFIVPTFDAKVTEYLRSGGFFSSDKFRLLN